jgi:hypothetical protein
MHPNNISEVTKSLLGDLIHQTELDNAVPILDELKHLSSDNPYAAPEITHSHNSSANNQSFDSGKYSKYPMVVAPMIPEADQSGHHAPMNIIKIICALLRILGTIVHPDCVEDAKKSIQLVLDSHEVLDQAACEVGLEALQKVCILVSDHVHVYFNDSFPFLRALAGEQDFF